MPLLTSNITSHCQHHCFFLVREISHLNLSATASISAFNDVRYFCSRSLLKCNVTYWIDWNNQTLSLRVLAKKKMTQIQNRVNWLTLNWFCKVTFILSWSATNSWWSYNVNRIHFWLKPFLAKRFYWKFELNFCMMKNSIGHSWQLLQV